MRVIQALGVIAALVAAPIPNTAQASRPQTMQPAVSRANPRPVVTAQDLSRGAPAAGRVALTQSELDALRAKLISLWKPPAAISTATACAGCRYRTVRVRSWPNCDTRAMSSF
jgi:hypothetical protein